MYYICRTPYKAINFNLSNILNTKHLMSEKFSIIGSRKMPMKEAQGEVSAPGNSLISIGKQLSKLFQLTTKTSANYEIVVDVQHQSFFNSEIFNLPNNLRPNWIGTVRDPIDRYASWYYYRTKPRTYRPPPLNLVI